MKLDPGNKCHWHLIGDTNIVLLNVRNDWFHVVPNCPLIENAALPLLNDHIPLVKCNIYHIEAETKRPPFGRQPFVFFEWLYIESIFTEIYQETNQQYGSIS